MDIQSSIIKAFATFLLLSYVKFLNATVDMLLPVKAKDVHGQVVGWYVYYDASYRYFHKDHLPYAIMGITCFLIFVLSPLVLLLIYPTTCFQRCLNTYRLRSHALQVFVDTFQGHYKDGTEPGTRDCRWFAAVYFLARIIILYIIFGYSKNVMCFALTGLSLILLGIAMNQILFQPYKSVKANKFHTTLPFITAFSCFLVIVFDEAEVNSRQMISLLYLVVGIFLFLPIFAHISYLVYYDMRRVCRKCKAEWLFHRPTNSEQQKLISKTKSVKICQVINIE